jgi:3-hydroxyisobutyrate dehydrogenase-like beta-hydroxyacid dehydrogenase
MPDLTFVGAGAMGSSLVRALAASGQQIALWNRTAGKARALVDSRISAAESLAEAISASPFIVVNVLDYRATFDVLEPVGDQLNGKIVIQTSSGTHLESRELDSWLAARGAEVVEVAILSVIDGIGTDENQMIVSGRAETFSQVASILQDAWKGTQAWVGDEAHLAKAFEASVLMFYVGASAGFIEGAVIAEHAGVPLDEYLKFTTGVLPALTAMQSLAVPMIKDRKFDFFDEPLHIWVSGITNVLKVAKAAGIDSSCTEPLLGRAQRRLEKYGPNQHISGTFEELYDPKELT